MNGCKWFMTPQNSSLLCVLPLDGQYWGTRWDAFARLWECVCYSWKYFAMEDNSKTSKFSTGQLCFCLLKMCAILLFCMFSTKQMHLLSFSLTSLDLPVHCNKLFHYNFNSLWGWRDNCHRHDSRVSGISVENGMLHVASTQYGGFPHLFSPPCFHHWGTYLVRNLFWRALLEGRHF